VNFINEIWCADLKDISTIAKYNNNNTFVLVVVDAFSKKAYTRLLKNKNAETMIQMFKSVLREAKAKPFYLFTDQGTEFTSERMQKFLRENNIHGYNIYSHIKSAIAERFIRTLFTKLQRYMTERNTLKIDDKIAEFTKTYNNTWHRTINMTPNGVSKDNEMEVWARMFKKHLREKPKTKPKFNVNDLVRISVEKLRFEKGKFKTT